MLSLGRKASKKSAPKVKKVEILQSMLIKPPRACTTTTTQSKPSPVEKRNPGRILTQMDPVSSPGLPLLPPRTCTTTTATQSKPSPVEKGNPGGILTQMDPVSPPGLPLLDDSLSVITIHSDNSTITTGNLGENHELNLLLAQLEGNAAADFLFEPTRIIPTPILSEPMRSPTPPPLHLIPPPPPPLPEATPAPPPPPTDSRHEAEKKRPRCHDHASPPKKRGKNLAHIREMVESDLEEGYRAEIPATQSSQQEGLHPKTPRELALTTYGSLKQMEPVYRAKLQEAKMKTAELERQLEAAKKRRKAPGQRHTVHRRFFKIR